MAQNAPTETVSGVVEQVNERGVKLQGRWWNFSKYDAVAPPARGQAVTLTVKGDFISAIAPAAAGPAGQGEDPFTGIEQSAPPANGQRRTGGGSGRPMSPERERTITRLSLLSSAATFYADRADATEVDVLETAKRWEAWASGPV